MVRTSSPIMAHTAGRDEQSAGGLGKIHQINFVTGCSTPAHFQSRRYVPPGKNPPANIRKMMSTESLPRSGRQKKKYMTGSCGWVTNTHSTGSAQRRHTHTRYFVWRKPYRR